MPLTVVALVAIFLKLIKKIPDLYILFMAPIFTNVFIHAYDYFSHGYLDPFWKVALVVGFFSSIFIVGLILLAFYVFLKIGKNNKQEK